MDKRKLRVENGRRKEICKRTLQKHFTVYLLMQFGFDQNGYEEGWFDY